ncbi:MAG: undecaprenyl-phosphate glucose phosphotransferase [Deltaproteobacteria bacterium]|nr:undecaprenyl-phosphate glucose phosphotransferase [Deltaproteobacteria bacterium]
MRQRRASLLKKHSQFIESLLFISDLFLIAASWLFSYYLRFHTSLIPADKGIPPLKSYMLLVIPILLIWGFAFRTFGLYRPRRIASHLSEIFDIAKACLLSVLVLVAVTFFFRQYEFSRLVFLFFGVITVAALSLERLLFREILRYARKKGHNLRCAVVVGMGDLSLAILKRIEMHPEIGIKIAGIVTTDRNEVGKELEGFKVIAVYDDLRKIIRDKEIDHVIIALEWEQHSKVAEVLKNIGDEMVDIKVIPDIYEFMTVRGGVDELDGLPIISLQGTPLYGWNIVAKRAADIVFSIIAVIITAPLMALIAILIKITSPGPVFYKQERMGIGGDTFQMLKFRSMRTDAEKESGAVWAKADDPRRTRLGTFLRKTSLDELPQFFNVLKGDMSIVGPRPERPVFIEEFRKNIPKYMLRHKMKAGITGWAQVNGLRGDTNLKKRIECDLYYIENWSVALDLKIMWLTIWKGLVNKNAY